FGQTVAIYLFLVVALRYFGRCHMASLTPAMYLSIALLGSAVETGLYCGSDSLLAGLVSAAAMVLANFAMNSFMNKWPQLSRWLVGVPVVLVHDGQIIPSHLRQVHMTEEDLRAALRKRGHDDVGAIRFAVMEVNGAVAVVPSMRGGGPGRLP